MESSPIYRTLHGAPMLGGVPAPYALGLVATAALLGFGMMSLTRTGGLVIVLGVLVTWGLLALVYGQDRVAVPLLVLRLRHRFPRRIVSYSRSAQRVVIEE